MAISTVRYFELVVDMGSVLDHGLLADAEGPGDKGVAAAFGHEGQHVELPVGELPETVGPVAGAGYHQGDDLGVQYRPAGADALESEQNVGISAIRCFSR